MPFTLATVRDRMPGGIVELPYGGRLAMSVRRLPRDEGVCANASLPTAATEAVMRNPRRERFGTVALTFSTSTFGCDCSAIGASNKTGAADTRTTEINAPGEVVGFYGTLDIACVMLY